MRNVCLVLSACLLFAGCQTNSVVIEEPAEEVSALSLVPKPSSMQLLGGRFRIEPDMIIFVQSNDGADEETAMLLADKLNGSTGFKVRVQVMSSSDQLSGIYLVRKNDEALGEEGYRLTVTESQVFIEANGAAGLFYGTQTFRQMLPVAFESSSKRFMPMEGWSVPCAAIEDVPRFKWRGMLLDCGRHFMDKEFVKRYIDLLALHKMNRLHWHLTEDQGWRIETKRYPKLTEVGGWRTYQDGTVYGGFYTQDDVREVVAYAKSRFVMVVPEIELPGHSVAALAAYPEYSCTGGPFEVETKWGVHKDVFCAGNDATFTFLQDILSETCELFDSPYIHIGGDECPKDRWQECAKCQARIKAEGLKDEHELQSYFIQRIEKFLQTKNKRIIGWDEILEGGLAQNATVQSWRGMGGAVEAVNSGHDAIVSPTSHAYFDYDISATDLRKVYTFEPVPDGIGADKVKHILGGECNMWTERAPQETIDSKVFPRILAMAEVLWSDKQGRSYEEFYQRVRGHYDRLDEIGVKYGPESRPVTIRAKLNAEAKEFEVSMESGEEGLELRYTSDGSEPDKDSNVYMGPVTIDETSTFKAQAFRDGKKYGGMESKEFIVHKATGKDIQLTNKYHQNYKGTGDKSLVDGIRGTDDFKDGFWQGYDGVDVEAVIDIGSSTKINSVKAGFMQNISTWIFLPKKVVVSVSQDGQTFTEVASLPHETTSKAGKVYVKDFEADVQGSKGRYVKLFAEGVKICPEWHPGAGNNCWLFIDEIVVE